MNKQCLLPAAILAFAATAMAGCKKPAPAQPPAGAEAPSIASAAAPANAVVSAQTFSHDASLEVFGYYLPTAPIAVGPC
jgi:hypothetical protein